MAYKISRAGYADIYGPTTGDRVRLGDTSLMLEVEKDHTVYGDECKFGGGKVLRDGMGQASGVSQEAALDVVITNALIITSATCRLALVASMPVDVLMKSAPAIIQTIEARATLVKVPSSPVEIIVFMCTSPQACRKALISL